MRGKKLIIIGALVALLVAGGAGAYFVYPMLSGAGQPSVAQAAEPRAQAPGTGPTYSLKERVLNLADKGSRHYLKLGVTLEFKAPQEWEGVAAAELSKQEAEWLTEIEKRSALISDVVTTLVSSQTTEQLTDPAGKDTLKEELRTRVNAVLGSPEVLFVYFTDFLIQ